MKETVLIDTAPSQIPPMKSQKRYFNWSKYLYIFMLLTVVYIILAPMVMLLYSSVGSERGKLPFEELNFTFSNYLQVLLDPQTYSLLGNTVVFTIGSTLIGISLSIFLAWVLERTSFPMTTLVFALIMIPMAIPNMIYAIGWMQLLNPNTGMINTMLQNLFGLVKGPFNIYSLGGMLFVQGISMVPTAFLMIAASFKTLDPTLEEQSAICGHRMNSTVRRVTFPILMPALLASTIYFTIVAMETFEIPGTLGLTAGIALLSSKIYFVTHPPSGLPDFGMASVLGVLMLFFAFILVWVYQRMTRSAEKYATITGKGYRPKKLDLGKWKWPTIAVVWGFVIISVILPLFSLLWGSLHPYYRKPSWEALQNISLESYKNVFNYPEIGKIAWNTFFMSVGSGLATILVVGIVSWIVVRGPYTPRARRLIDTIAFLPIALPGIVVGLALMFFYIYFPLPLYGTIWVMIIGMVTKYIAFGERTMVSAQMQISKDLEEASLMAGSGMFETMRKITIPLISPALFYTFIWVAVHAMRELPVLVMLYSPDSMVASTLIWSLWEDGNVSMAAVLGIFLIVFFGIFFYCGKWLVDLSTNKIPSTSKTKL